jgi:hypothetical protein
MSYTPAELIQLHDQHRILDEKLALHVNSCADCWLYDWDSENTLPDCKFRVKLHFELDSIGEALNYTERSDEDDELVATYITAEHTNDSLWTSYEPDESAEHFGERTDAWLLSPAGQKALTESFVEAYEDLSVQETTAAWVDGVLMNQVYYYDDDLSRHNFFANARIWLTKRGQVGIYKTFLTPLSPEAGMAFEAYCSVCKLRSVFHETNKGLFVQQLLKVVEHAHTHVAESTLVFHHDDETGNRSVEYSGTEADNQSDVEYITKAGNWALDYFRTKFRASQRYGSQPLSSQELSLGKNWAAFIKQLA